MTQKKKKVEASNLTTFPRLNCLRPMISEESVVYDEEYNPIPIADVKEGDSLLCGVGEGEVGLAVIEQIDSSFKNSSVSLRVGTCEMRCHPETLVYCRIDNSEIASSFTLFGKDGNLHEIRVMGLKEDEIARVVLDGFHQRSTDVAYGVSAAGKDLVVLGNNFISLQKRLRRGIDIQYQTKLSTKKTFYPTMAKDVTVDMETYLLMDGSVMTSKVEEKHMIESPIRMYELTLDNNHNLIVDDFLVGSFSIDAMPEISLH